jgi:hypothetical protein
MFDGDSYGVFGFTPLIVKDLITTKYGKDKWAEVISRSGCADDFRTHTKYSLEVWGKFVTGCCETLKLNVDELLEVLFLFSNKSHDLTQKNALSTLFLLEFLIIKLQFFNAASHLQYIVS